MAWEPASIEPSPGPAIVLDPAFPVDFDEARLSRLTWNRDSEHFPVALAPLAGEHARIIGASLNSLYEFGEFPQRWYAAVWHGYVYYAFEPNVTPEEWPATRQRVIDMSRERAPVTEAYWRDEVVPELRGIYADLDRIDPSGMSGPELAESWQHAWRAVERAWELHMTFAPGSIQSLVDLREVCQAVSPDAPAADAFRMIQGQRHELFRMELDTEKLADAARSLPAVSGALQAGVRSLEALASQAGGQTFVSRVEDFLAEHGHLGQATDDLTLPSFGEAPELLLGEVAKRIDHPPERAVDRVERLLRDARQLAGATRAQLGDRPELLGRFEATLALAQRIGNLSDIHNYWIDRAVQAHLRRLVMRVGNRLVSDGVLERPEDVFYLARGEVPELVRTPRDMRPVVAERRREHDRQKTMTPPTSIGGPAREQPPVDQAGAAAGQPEPVLRGVGASPGIARGAARLVAGADEFERIRPGDIIVTHFTNPSWIPVFTIAGGLVTDMGGVISHPAVVAREFGLPAVVGTRDATSRILEAQEIEIDGTTGTVRLF